MFRTIIAGAAVAGALTLGAAGIAGASTPATGVHGRRHGRPMCAKLPAIAGQGPEGRGQGADVGAQGRGP